MQYDAQGRMSFKAGASAAQHRYSDFNGLDQLILVAIGQGDQTELMLNYSPGGERYLRREKVGGQLTTTRHYGSVEEVRKSNGTVETKRYLGGVVIEVITGTAFATGPRELRYLFNDHLGSLDLITSSSGAVIERLSFDPHGRRRVVSDWRSNAVVAVPTTTPRGFTGHEHFDSFGFVHMNGRVYDPELGRFMQPDPMIDAGLQGYNRYSYVLNNPLSLTDPTGYLSFGQILRIAVAVVITVYTGGWAAGYWGSALTAGQAFGVAVAGGFAAGAVTTGTLKGGLQGAFSAAAFYGVGSYFEGAKWAKNADDASKLSSIGRTAKIVAHGATGGIVSDVQGGKFASGFISAGISEAALPATAGVQSPFERGALQALIGGTASAASGGKFVNGAVTSAMAFAFGKMAESRAQDRDGGTRRVIRPEVGIQAAAAADEVLGGALSKVFGSMDEASVAWSDAVQPVADRFDTEIAAKFFKISEGEFMIGRSTSDGVICSLSVGCSVNVRIAPSIGGMATLSGYIHTHPGNTNFSGADLYTAYRFYRDTGLHQSAYVSLMNRQVWTWSSQSWQNNPKSGSWNDYGQFSRRVR
jgi:RHS repeat-associated protein